MLVYERNPDIAPASGGTITEAIEELVRRIVKEEIQKYIWDLDDIFEDDA